MRLYRLLLLMAVLSISLTSGVVETSAEAVTCPGRPATCADLVVYQTGPEGPLEASPSAQITLTVAVENQGLRPAAVLPGTTLLQETLPQIVAMAPGYSNSGTTNTVRGVDPQNTVRLTQITAPQGYTCLNEPTNVSRVTCTRDTNASRDQITKGHHLVFTFTMALIDPSHPYIIVDPSLIGGSKPLTLRTTATATVDPQGVIPDSIIENNSVTTTIVLHAPHLQFQLDCVKLNDCAINVVSSQSSAPALVPVGSLQLKIGFELIPGCDAACSPNPGGPSDVTGSCSASRGWICSVTHFTDVSAGHIHWSMTCQAMSTVTIRRGGEVGCRLLLSAPAGTHTSADADPTAGFFSPDTIIRFVAAPAGSNQTTELNATGVFFLAGGSMDWF
jgi:hypothetical protein